ncbi:MAG: ROK family protein [Planctomycetaceae bacterium]|nr:MAG: ROK family protein [Planctomycetaceae bacterium]
MESFYVAIDIGAGLGVKIGVFTEPFTQIGFGLLRRDRSEEDYSQFVSGLLQTIESVTKEVGKTIKDVRGIGISSPGLFNSDGSYLLPANLEYLTGHNLKQDLSDTTGLPVAIENDANVGGMAEWSVLRTDLLYWVFGGGWGGSWIDSSGKVQFPSVNWDRDDRSLHYTNEPGFAIPLDKFSLRTVFYQHGASFDRFQQIVVEDLGLSDAHLTGPHGDPDSIRAEVLLSGLGRCRLFRTMVGNDDFYERFLDIHETDQMSDPSVAGEYISKLSMMRVEAAINTDRLFGRILAQATQTMFRQAIPHGLRNGLPICLGGKPSYALPYFGPSAQRRMGALGVMSYLRPSAIDERGLNANLVGAAVLAEKAADEA